ncbi:MAG TPA: hypothetical protein VF006_19365 [Longimicrobium sp.]
MRRMLVPLAALLLAACGGDDEAAEAAAASDTLTTPTVDTAGMGTNPPTAGGQLVDTAAVPGATDTVQGTPTAP